MKSTPMILALVGLSIGFSPMAIAATVCSADVSVPLSARVFGKVNDQGNWNEYRSFDQLPKLEPESGMYALYWNPTKKSHSVYIVQLQQSFYIQTRYCFDNTGKLEGVNYEIGSHLGWGHRQEGQVVNGGFDPTKAEFYRTMDGKSIGKPFGPGAVPHELKPTLYMSMNDLPFASFLLRR